MKKEILTGLVCLFTATLAFAGGYNERSTTSTTDTQTTTHSTDHSTTYNDPNMKFQNTIIYPTTMQEARSMSQGEIPSEQRTIY